MTDSIAVINAGSSSLKFSLFALRGDALEPVARGQAEGLFTAPKFVAKNAAGAVLAEKSWGEGASLGHGGALDHLIAFIRSGFAGHRLVGVGHRVVHGGLEYATPVLLNATVVAALEKYVPLAPLHQRRIVYPRVSFQWRHMRGVFPERRPTGQRQPGPNGQAVGPLDTETNR